MLLRYLILQFELKLRKKIKCINFDRGGKYKGKYLLNCRIKASYTMLGISKQNEIAEKRNHTLMDLMRYMLAHSTLPNFQ